MIDTKKWRENLRQMIFENEWCFRDIEERMLLDEIDRLTAELERRTAELHYANTACMEMKHELDRLNAELDRYRWLPYPANKPSEKKMWSVTVTSIVYNEYIDEYYWNGEGWNKPNDCTVTAYRPRPEAYIPPSSEVTP